MSGTALRTLVLVPVYNHVRTLREVVRGCLEQGFPVLVVDDGSTDGSFEAVTDLPVERHRLPMNCGKGAAILAGAAIARTHGFDAVMTIDADGQHDPRDGWSLVRAAEANWPAIVVGARAMETPNVPSSSLFGRNFSNFWVRMECGQTIADTQSGYRIYPVALLIETRFLSRRYAFEVEVLVKGAWAGLPVISQPVSVYYPPGDERVSHFHKLKDNFRLSCLHTWLVLTSLAPWHRRRPTPHATGEKVPSLLHPVRFFRYLSREHSSPVELGAAVWAGIFIGSLPIIPFGNAVILYVNHKLHLNKLAGVGAANICVAPFVPLACIEVGHFIRYGRLWTDFNRQTLVMEIHQRFWEWLLGAMVVGPLLGFIGAFITILLVRKLRSVSPS